MTLGQEQLDQLEVAERSPGYRLIAQRMTEMLTNYRHTLEDHVDLLNNSGLTGECRGKVQLLKLCLRLPQILMDEARKAVTAEAKAGRKR